MSSSSVMPAAPANVPYAINAAQLALLNQRVACVKDKTDLLRAIIYHRQVLQKSKSRTATWDELLQMAHKDSLKEFIVHVLKGINCYESSCSAAPIQRTEHVEKLQKMGLLNYLNVDSRQILFDKFCDIEGKENDIELKQHLYNAALALDPSKANVIQNYNAQLLCSYIKGKYRETTLTSGWMGNYQKSNFGDINDDDLDILAQYWHRMIKDPLSYWQYVGQTKLGNQLKSIYNMPFNAATCVYNKAIVPACNTACNVAKTLSENKSAIAATAGALTAGYVAGSTGMF